MNRRGLFRVLGLGAASAALAPVVAMAAKVAPEAEIVRPKNTIYCNCGSTPNHGCPRHMTGVYETPVGTLVPRHVAPGFPPAVYIKHAGGWVLWDGVFNPLN